VELDPPNEREKIKWFLITSISIHTLEEAIKIIE
jgi:hypothetical protein